MSSRSGLELDATDRAILAALQQDGRIALSELGRRIGLSQPAMSERVRRLEERGIITGYGARIDPKALGIATSAIMRLRTTHEHIKPCLELFRALPEVIDVYRVTGRTASSCGSWCRHPKTSSASWTRWRDTAPSRPA